MPCGALCGLHMPHTLFASVRGTRCPGSCPIPRLCPFECILCPTKSPPVPAPPNSTASIFSYVNYTFEIALQTLARANEVFGHECHHAGSRGRRVAAAGGRGVCAGERRAGCAAVCHHRLAIAGARSA